MQRLRQERRTAAPDRVKHIVEHLQCGERVVDLALEESTEALEVLRGASDTQTVSATLPSPGSEHHTYNDAFGAGDDDILVERVTLQSDEQSGTRPPDQISGMREVPPLLEGENARRRFADAFRALQEQPRSPITYQQSPQAHTQEQHNSGRRSIDSSHNANSSPASSGVCGTDSRYEMSEPAMSVEAVNQNDDHATTYIGNAPHKRNLSRSRIDTHLFLSPTNGSCNAEDVQNCVSDDIVIVSERWRAFQYDIGLKYLRALTTRIQACPENIFNTMIDSDSLSIRLDHVVSSYPRDFHVGRP